MGTRLGIYSCDFDYIKKLADAGKSINQLTKDGCSLFTAFLNGYYEDIIEDEEEKAVRTVDSEYGYDRIGSLNKYQEQSLDERKDGILSKLEWFMSHEVNLNLVDAEQDNCETALSLVEWYEDYYMMKYLLEHGADPKTWYTAKSERFGNQDFEHELIDSLDCAMQDTCGNYLRNQKRIAWLLMDYGMPVGGVFRRINDAVSEYKKWHEITDSIEIEELSQEELFNTMCKLFEMDIVDYKFVKELLDRFIPWDAEHSYEHLFSQAFYGRNYDLFKLLYEYCPHPDYDCDYMSCDVFWDAQYLDNIPYNRMKEELAGEELADAIEDGITKIRMIHYMLKHEDAVVAYKSKTGNDESMMRNLVYKIDHEFDEETRLDIMQYEKVIIELAAFHVFDDFGPTIYKEFDVDRLDNYRIHYLGSNEKWAFYDYNDEIVAVF